MFFARLLLTCLPGPILLVSCCSCSITRKRSHSPSRRSRSPVHKRPRISRDDREYYSRRSPERRHRKSPERSERNDRYDRGYRDDRGRHKPYTSRDEKIASNTELRDTIPAPSRSRDPSVSSVQIQQTNSRMDVRLSIPFFS